MAKPRETYIGNLRVLETKITYAGKSLPQGRILVKLRKPIGDPFWCEMSEEDYSKAIEHGEPVQIGRELKLLKQA